MTRILLVEDSPTQAKELEIILEADGFEVRTAADGESALEMLRAASFDLVISDIVMPGLSGYDLCRAVKADPHTRHVPVMLVTSLSDPAEVIQGLESGADNFLGKPYEPAYLVKRIEQLLESRRIREEKGAADGALQVMFLGRTFNVVSEKEQILDLLISTFEDTIRKNRELEESRAQLAETLAKLESANKELEAFSYSVSHDLRAPLRHIEGFAAMLEDHAGGLDEQGQHFLGRIRASTARMNELIHALLQLPHVSRMGLHRQDVDPAKIAGSVVESLREAEPSREVDVVVHAMPRAFADANLLRVVFENLVGNAWKFTSKVERASIEIGATASGAGVELFVKDNGAGFDPARAGKLFTPFQRLHADRAFPGTGLGLATVRRIIERHGGRVWADAAPGRGATFTFTLPASTTRRDEGGS